MWPSALSGRLCIIALVSRCLTNKLMHRRSIHRQSLSAFFNSKAMPPYCLWGLMLRFQSVSPCHGQVPCVLLTRSPLNETRRLHSVRLACIRHAASVHPEPGSNSPFDIDSTLMRLFRYDFCLSIVSESTCFSIRFVCLSVEFSKNNHL